MFPDRGYLVGALETSAGECLVSIFHCIVWPVLSMWRNSHVETDCAKGEVDERR